MTIGRNVFVGEGSVLDIDTEMGDDSQLGHASSLNRGQQVPAGKQFHGSPAQETDTGFNRGTPLRCTNAAQVRLLFCSPALLAHRRVASRRLGFALALYLVFRRLQSVGGAA